MRVSGPPGGPPHFWHLRRLHRPGALTPLPPPRPLPQAKAPRAVRAQRMVCMAAVSPPPAPQSGPDGAADQLLPSGPPPPTLTPPRPPAAHPPPPQDKAAVLSDVRGIIAEQLGAELDTVLAESKFVDLGADSLDTVEIMMALEEKFDIQLDEEGAEKISTVQEAADLISAQIDK